MGYIIKELSDQYADCNGGTPTNARSLTAAKRAAGRMQAYQGTVMVIENSFGDRFAYKEGGKWYDMDEYAD